jgi:hypothetical protein
MSAESQQRKPLLENGSAKTLLARQLLNSRYVIASTDTHTIMEAVFSVPSVPRPYKDDQLPLGDT